MKINLLLFDNVYQQGKNATSAIAKILPLFGLTHRLKMSELSEVISEQASRPQWRKGAAGEQTVDDGEESWSEV